MPRLNPNEALRKAHIAAFTIPTFAKKIPKSATIPQQYILLTSQTKSRTAITKKCWEWLCTINIDCYSVNASGYASPVQNDNTEQMVVQAIEAGLNVIGWYVKEANFIQSIDLDVETDTQSIERRVITYEYWLGQLTT